MSAGERKRLIMMLGAAVLIAAALIALAVFEPKQAAAGWLIGFLFWSQIPVGSMVLSMIHSLTGGRWGLVLRPVLIPATTAVPWLLLAVIPVLIAVPVLYPWTMPGGGIKPDVAAGYLNVPFFIARTIVTLGIWSALALLIQFAPGRQALLAAGVGLVLYGITVSLVGIDWFLSLEPPFVSSSFGASVGIMQMIAAMAWAALLAPVPADDPAVGDIGGLLLALLLGITYVDFMAVLVIWYGDLPSKTAWFVVRDRLPWSAIAAAAFILASVAPIFALFLSRVRRSRVALRVIAASVLVGSLLYIVYLTAPPFGAACLLPATLAVAAIGLLQAAAMTGASRALMRREASAHGY
jgi:hypothetical protein